MSKVERLIKHFHPEHYQLSIDIDRPGRRFDGTVTIRGEVQPNTNKIALHAKDLHVTSVSFDGKQAEFMAGEDDALILSHPDISPGEHVVVIGYSGQITDGMHGMYPCYYVHDGIKKELIATQFESHHAREVLPCIDEPEAKATFEVTLTTETDVTVLGNMPVNQQIEQSDRLVTKFKTTPRMSTYLLAWVYGEMHNKSAKTSSGVEVNVWATPAQRPESLDFALKHAVETIDFFDEYFGVPYPLPKSDHVALPDFASGAMENWGLITYREVALLADPATTTVASKQYIATVISHELSHQWFGNLVTMKWWNNLWLNESFATLMEYIAVDAIHPEWNAWLDFATHESILALRRDAIAGVQPVQVDVDHPDEISSLFDGAIVYAKGARLMRMCQAYIGHTAFQKGLQNYFREYAYGNTEAEDLWHHLSKASGQDITELMNTWISQSGYPVVHVTAKGLSQEQFFIGPHQESSQVWPIPLNANTREDMPALLETHQLKMPVTEDIRFNVGDTAHFLTHYPGSHLSTILNKHDLSEIERLQLLHEQTLLARGGVIPSADLIDLLLSYRHETANSVWEIMSLTIGELKKFVETNQLAEQQLRRLAGQLADNQFQRLGWESNSGESEDDTKLRSTILGLMAYSEDRAVLENIDQLFAKGVESIDPEIRSLVISSVVGRTEDKKVIERLMHTYSSSQSADLRDDLSVGLTSAKDSGHINYLLSQYTNTDSIRTQDIARWFAYMIRNRYAREATWQWVQDNWQWIVDTFQGDKSFDDFARYAATGLSTKEQLDSYRQFFTPKRSYPALRRVIDLGVLEIEARVDTLESDSSAVHQRLAQL